MRVLVVAGTGFVGGHVARAFAERGDEVTALVRSRARGEADARLSGVRLVEGTLGTLPAEVLSTPQDVVVHAAGVWRPDERATHAEIGRRCEEVYVRGVEALSERALAWKAHFVFLSGVSRYGDRMFDRPLSEDVPAGALSVYGAHKRKSEAILAGLGERGLIWTAIVPPELYGSHDPGGYVRFVCERVRDRRFLLLGSGDNRWSLCNVRNVADAVVHVARSGAVGPLHVADARAWTQREIAVLVARALGRHTWFPRVPRRVALLLARVNARLPRAPWGPARFSEAHVRARTATLLLDTSRACAFGFEPRFGLEEGIDEEVAWLNGADRC